MKEGKLSSALMKRYGISKKDAVGKVLWHSLNENGKIDVYDMKCLMRFEICNSGLRPLFLHEIIG